MPSGKHRDRKAELLAGLAAAQAGGMALPGITGVSERDTLVEQMISSLRRIEYVRQFRLRPPASASLANPLAQEFDPLKGAFYLETRGRRDEAVWLTFVGTHFGKHIDDAWKLAANVMGSFGQDPVWDLATYSGAPAAFEAMLINNGAALGDPHVSGRYSNHRQYQSKKPDLIAQVFSTFHEWLMALGGIDARVRAIHGRVGQEPEKVFAELYRSMDEVYGFGRLGRFDFLTMVGKLDLAPIEADSVHLVGATGPLAGARLLLTNDRKGGGTPKTIEREIDRLDDFLQVGKQVLEDSLCNWQKNPDRFIYFRG